MSTETNNDDGIVEASDMLEPTEVILAKDTGDAIASADVKPLMSDEATLAFTQNTRLTIASQLMSKGTIPEDKGDRALLMNVLDGMDRQVINKMRVDAEKDQTNALAAAAVSIGHLLNTVSNDVYRTPTPVARELPELPIECITLVEGNLVEGELSTSYTQETIDEFRARTDPPTD